MAKCNLGDVKHETIGSLSNDVFERRTSTRSRLFSFLDNGFAQIFSQIVSIRVKNLRNTNFLQSSHIKGAMSSHTHARANENKLEKDGPSFSSSVGDFGRLFLSV